MKVRARAKRARGRRLVAFVAAAVLFSHVAVSYADYGENPRILSGRTDGSFSTAILVDGLLDDWGTAWVIAGLPAEVDRLNSEWLPGAAGTCYWIEDGVGPKGRVGPGRGGQNFDHEAAYIGADLASLNIAIVTGTEQAGNKGGYHTGDIFLDIDDNDQWDIAVATHDHGSLVAGSVYAPTPEYADGVWWTHGTDFPGSAPARIRGARVVEMFALDSAFIYTNPIELDDPRGTCGPFEPDDHNVIELSVLWSQLAAYDLEAGTRMAMYFTMTCGNDVIAMDCDLPSDDKGPRVPEPATVLLTASGLAALILRKRRK